MIFCNACGASRYKAPARDRSPAPQEASPALSGPRFIGTARGFARRWIGWTLGGTFLAWMVQSVFQPPVSAAAYSHYGVMGARLVSQAFAILLFGTTIGGIQSAALRRAVAGPNVRWLQKTLIGLLLGALAGLIQPDTGLQQTTIYDQLLWAVFHGVTGGGLLGVLQALALRKLGPGPWMIRWPLLSIATHIFGSASGVLVWHHLIQGGSAIGRYHLGALAYFLVLALSNTVPQGILLGRWLHRQFGSTDALPDE